MNPVRSRDRNLNINKNMKMNIVKINNLKYQTRELIAICPVRSNKYLHTILNFNHYQLIKAASNGVCF